MDDFRHLFTALLVGTWAAFTVFEIDRAERKVREAKGRAEESADVVGKLMP